MTLSVHALTTVAKMESVLGVTADSKTAILEALIEEVSSAIEQYVEFHLEYNTAIVEKTEGYGDPFLYVKRRPILSITSILRIDVEGNTVYTWASTDYRIEDDGLGAIYNPASWPNTSLSGSGLIDQSIIMGHEGKSLQVTYAGGYVTPQQVIDDATLTRTLPFDIERACVDSAKAQYKREGLDENLASKTTEQVTTAWKQPTAFSGDESILTQRAQSILNRYRNVRF